MFAGLLNKGFRGSLLLLAVYFTLLLISNFFFSRAIELNAYPDIFYNYFSHKFEGKAWIIVVNFSFAALGALLVSYISVEQEISEKLNYFPVFIYLLLTTICLNPFQLNPQVIANVFILYSFFRLLDTYRKEDVLRQVFEASLWLSVSFFITISGFCYLPLFFIGLFILRPFYWREWVVALLGFATPVYFYECLAYLSDFNRWYIFEALSGYIQSFRQPAFSEYYMALLICLLLLLFVSLFQEFSAGFGNTVKKQKARSILIWYLLFSIFGFFSGGANSSGIICIYALPLCFFIGDFLFGMKMLKIANTILAVLILSALLVFMGHLGII